MLSPTRFHYRSLLGRWGILSLVFFSIWTLYLYSQVKHLLLFHPHTITTSSIISSTKYIPLHLHLPPQTAATFCHEVNFPVYDHTSARKRRVYDLFLFNTELDWLEIRLHTLAPSVDYFVIVESPVTFTKKAKPLVLKENWDRFKDFHSKIIYHTLEDPPTSANGKWDLEIYQRNAMFTQVFPFLTDEKKAMEGDVIVVSDVDEIPRPATMMVLRNCDVPKRVTIRSQFYYYSFQWLHRGKQWQHGQATTYHGINTILPVPLRTGNGDWNWLNIWREKANIWNAGWHCSTCFERVSQVLEKMGSFSHTEYNQERWRNQKGIVERVRAGRDLWDRRGEYYDRVESNQDIPEYLKGDRSRWGFMLDRDGVNAGFVDVEA